MRTSLTNRRAMIRKTIKTIESCKTLEQLEAAEKFANLVERRLRRYYSILTSDMVMKYARELLRWKRFTLQQKAWPGSLQDVGGIETYKN